MRLNACRSQRVDHGLWLTAQPIHTQVQGRHRIAGGGNALRLIGITPLQQQRAEPVRKVVAQSESCGG